MSNSSNPCNKGAILQTSSLLTGKQSTVIKLIIYSRIYSDKYVSFESVIRFSLFLFVTVAKMRCLTCNKIFKNRQGLGKHAKHCRNKSKLRCDICDKYETAVSTNMKRHRLVCINRLSDGIIDDSDDIAYKSNSKKEASYSSKGSNFPCDICRRPHTTMSALIDHRNVHNSVPTGLPTVINNDFASLELSKHAFGGHVCDYDLTTHEPCPDALAYFDMSADLFSNLFTTLSSSYVIRARMIARGRFFKMDEAGRIIEEVYLYYPSYEQELITAEWYEKHSRRIINALETMNHNSSNLTFDCIERVYLKLTMSDNINGQGVFALPPKLAQKKGAIVNVNSQSKCFKYALLSILHFNDVKFNQRMNQDSYKEWEDELDFGELDIDKVSLNDIPKIERLLKIKINIHVWEGASTLTIRYNSRHTIAPRTVNLLLVAYQGLQHYCGISSLARLYRDPKDTHSSRFCERCCRKFSTGGTKSANSVQQDLDEHYRYCNDGLLQIESLPKEKHYSYTNFSAEESPVVVCYSDIECYITPQDKKHVPFAIGAYSVYHEHFTAKRNAESMRTWTGEKCLQDYLKYLDRFVKELDSQIDKISNESMIIDPQEQSEFNKALHCPRCKTQFTREGKHIKVRDHCHITGRYRGPLCHICNSRLRLKRRILPVVFHNFKGYDGHLICKQAIGEMPGWHLSVIPTTHEKYMSVRVNVEVGRNYNGRKRFFQIIFLDSFQFLSSSLANLSANLDSLPFTEFRMRSRFPDISDVVIRRKGVFPYSYFNSPSRLQESCLPPIKAFYDELSGEECSSEDYAHAQRAWVELGCRTLREYLVRYLHLDIYLLTDVFEAFRKVSLQEDGLDPVHFVSLPGLSYASCFKMNRETIDLLQDVDMVRLFERGIRGGLTFVNRHKLQAHIPELNNNHDENIHLAYIDQNNLYGSSLCRPLPHSEFTWVSEDELQQLSDPTKIQNLDDEGDYGYLFEVDLEYPSELHDATVDFPLAPETDFVDTDLFSTHMMEYYKSLCITRGVQNRYVANKKLLLSQFDKESYVCHYAILKFYLAMGMKLLKLRSAIRFRQKRFVEPYIRYNSNKRSLAHNAFEKDFYKLKNNSFFGKTMESVRHRIDFRLVNNFEKLERLASSPLFIDRNIFSDNVVGVHMFKSKVVLDKPVYIGQAVLDYSKLEMYNLYYNILRKCPLIRQPELVGGDTDSFFLALHTDKNISLSDVFSSLDIHFDSSNYPPDHPLYSTLNKAKLGCFKDEAAGKLIEEMILLRPKMYSMKFLGQGTSIKRAKGISRHLVASTTHESYRNVFDNQTESTYEMTILRSQLHTIQTTTFKKRGLSAFDDKRCWLDSNISVPHGSYLSDLPRKRRRVIVTPVSGDIIDFPNK